MDCCSTSIGSFQPRCPLVFIHRLSLAHQQPANKCLLLLPNYLKAPITSAKLTKSGWYSMYMDAENQLSGCNIRSKSNGSKLIQICLQAHSCTHSMRVIASCCWFKWPGLTPSANRTENTRSREYTNRNITQSGLMFCLRLRLAHTGLNELRLRTKLLF